MKRIKFIVFTSSSFYDGKPRQVTHMVEVGEPYNDFGICDSIVREEVGVNERFKCYFGDDVLVVNNVERYFIEQL